MFNFIRVLWPRKKSERDEEEEGFEQGFYGLPHPKERAALSPEKLAILLSGQEPGKPAHILVEHELNLRIAQVQARAAARASYMGIVGVVVGVVVTALLTAWLQKPLPKETPQKVLVGSERNFDSATKPRADTSVTTGNPSIVISIPTEHESTEKQKSNPKK